MSVPMKHKLYNRITSPQYGVTITVVAFATIFSFGYLLFPQFRLAGQEMAHSSLYNRTTEFAIPKLSAAEESSLAQFTADELIQNQPFANEPYVEPYCGKLAQEAEEGLLSGFFTIGSDDQASGGRYVHVAQGWGERFDGLDSVHKVSYCIDVPAAGTYQILATTYANGASNDSMYLQIDGLPAGGYIWNVEQSATYSESYVTDAILGGPIMLNLSAGRHTLAFYLREDDTRLDKFELRPILTSASISPTHSNRLHNVDTGVLGNVFTDMGYTWLPKLAEPQIANLRVDVVDTATNGEIYRHSTFTDSDGDYRVADLAPGSYSIELEVPDGHISIGPSSMIVSVQNNQLSIASFDLLLVDDLSDFTPFGADNKAEGTKADNAVADDVLSDDLSMPRIYVPIVQQ